jgi:hypothetical protein
VKKLIVPLLAAVLLLACTISTAPVVPAKTPIPPNAVSGQPTPTAVKTEIPFEFTEAPQQGDPVGSNITVVELHLTGGPLPDQLADQAQAAAGLGQDPILYFTANW